MVWVFGLGFFLIFSKRLFVAVLPIRIEVSSGSGKYVTVVTKLCETGRANEELYTLSRVKALVTRQYKCLFALLQYIKLFY